MPVNFLKIPADEAVQILDECIVSGFELKKKIDSEYYSSRQNGQFNTNQAEYLKGWQKEQVYWVVATKEKLNQVYTSSRYADDFEDTLGSGYGLVGENTQWCNLSDRIRSRVKKLISFDDFIKREFRIEYVAGDKVEGNKYQQDGDGNTQQIH